MKVLYTSAELHDAIKHVLGSAAKGERRVVLVAYLGAQAEAFLPHAQGLEIVCSMEPGATSADSIIRLRDRGASVSQADGLHMKVYWSSKKGAVICSANASANALARGGLKEAGVLLPPGAVKIDKLIRYARPRPISDRDLQTLARESDRLWPVRARTAHRRPDESPSLEEWLSSRSHKPWKIGWWYQVTSHFSSAELAEAAERHGTKTPYAAVDCGTGHCRSGDWVLKFDATSGRTATWMYVDFVVNVSRKDKRHYSPKYPVSAVQVHRSSEYGPSPFRLNAESRRAIAAAVRAMGPEAFESSTTARVPAKFIRLLKLYSVATRQRHFDFE